MYLEQDNPYASGSFNHFSTADTTVSCLTELMRLNNGPKVHLEFCMDGMFCRKIVFIEVLGRTQGACQSDLLRGYYFLEFSSWRSFCFKNHDEEKKI